MSDERLAASVFAYVGSSREHWMLACSFTADSRCEQVSVDTAVARGTRMAEKDTADLHLFLAWRLSKGAWRPH